MKIAYFNIYIHYVMVTKNRFPFIYEEHRERIEKYMTGIAQNNHSRLYAIYANPDHVHLLISRSPEISDEFLATKIAVATSKFINDNHLTKGSFSWQESCAAFSVSKKGVKFVCEYIYNQKEHHKKISFESEYKEFIKHYQETIHWNKVPASKFKPEKE